MKQTIRVLVFVMMAAFGTHVSAYSGELWLSQADQEFGTPASTLAHGFLAGVVHSWNNRREQNFPKLCFNAPADQMQIRNLMEIVKEYIGERDPDLKAPAQSIIRVAMMGRFPCREKT
jgi:hypothetical protein